MRTLISRQPGIERHGFRQPPGVSGTDGVGVDFAPASLLAAIPALYSTEPVELEQKVLCAKWFSPYKGWTWYACEIAAPGQDGYEEGLCFGWVHGHEREWGYFTLHELAQLVGMGGKLPIVERDVHFEACTPSEIR